MTKDEIINIVEKASGITGDMREGFKFIIDGNQWHIRAEASIFALQTTLTLILTIENHIVIYDSGLSKLEIDEYTELFQRLDTKRLMIAGQKRTDAYKLYKAAGGLT